MKSFPLAPPTPARRDLADPRSTVAPRNLGAKPTLNDPRSTRWGAEPGRLAPGLGSPAAHSRRRTGVLAKEMFELW